MSVPSSKHFDLLDAVVFFFFFDFFTIGIHHATLFQRDVYFYFYFLFWGKMESRRTALNYYFLKSELNFHARPLL